MRIFNSLTKAIEEFEPMNSAQVGMYTCGPTVYDYQHIGNFRTMTLSDLLARTLRYLGYKVKTVRNITDIDDKIIKGAKEKGLPIREFSKEFTRIFFEDLEKLNIAPVDVTTFATEYVPKMIGYIEDLIGKGFAYVEGDGSVYFKVEKFNDYGKLSGLDPKDLKSGTRVLSDEYTKENISDFALWKSVGQGEPEGFQSPWGRGRPGWHIECSVMSQDNLGEQFDIHVGGKDLLFPHHENEIAQSEAKTGKQFVKYWVHGEFLMVDGGKMSKSLKNFYTISDISMKGFNPLALRYFYLTGHYRSQLNFTWTALEAASNALNRLYGKVSELKEQAPRTGGVVKNYLDEFKEIVSEDLNMPQALAVMWKLVDDRGVSAEDKLATVYSFDGVLGLRLEAAHKKVLDGGRVPEEVSELLRKREELRKEKKFAEADLLRREILEKGYEVVDTGEGVKLRENR